MLTGLATGSGVMPHCGMHRRISGCHSSLLVFTLLPFPPPRPFCSSLSSFWPLLVRSPSSYTYLRLDYRAFHVLSDCALLTRILPRNYQEEEIVGRKVCRQKTRSRMKGEGKGEGRLPTILSFPRASVRTSEATKRHSGQNDSVFPSSPPCGGSI